MFRWIHATSLVVTAIALFGFVAGPGCQPPKGKDSNTPKEKEKDVQLKAAIDLLHGKKIETSKKLENAAAPASADSTEVPN